MIVNVVLKADPPYALVEGIQSDLALSVLIRAVVHSHAFGRYSYVVADLTGFEDRSPRVVNGLAVAVRTAADAGHWLAFFPVDSGCMRGPDTGLFHCYPDWAHVRRAMQHDRHIAAAKRSRGATGAARSRYH